MFSAGQRVGNAGIIIIIMEKLLLQLRLGNAQTNERMLANRVASLEAQVGIVV